MFISKYYYIFPLLLSLATYYLLFKEQRIRKEKEMSKNTSWAKHIGVIVGIVLAIIGISYIFSRENILGIIKIIVVVLHAIWFVGIIFWIQKLRNQTLRD